MSGLKTGWIRIAVGALAACLRANAQYVAPDTCATCHQGIWETYRKTGMARSFYRPTVANVVEDYSERNTYYHKPSNRYFAMVQREGKFYQRRYQLDSTGRQINVLE